MTANNLVTPWHPNYINIQRNELPGSGSRFQTGWVVVGLDSWLVKQESRSCRDLVHQYGDMALRWHNPSEEHPVVAIEGDAYFNPSDDAVWVFQGDRWDMVAATSYP